MHLSNVNSAHEIIHSDSVLRALSDDWVCKNKTRIHMRETNTLSAQTEAVKPPKSEFAVNMQEKSTVVPKNKPGPYVMASLRNVLCSRMDLVQVTSAVVPQDQTYRPQVIPNTRDSSVSYTENLSINTKAMCTIENKIMTRVCNKFLQQTPPYCTSKQTLPVQVPTASSCWAHVTMNDTKNSKNIFLSISAPHTEQIKTCKTNELYNKNMKTNIGHALMSHNVQVIMHPTIDSGSPSSSEYTNENQKRSPCIDAIEIDTTTPIEPLVTEQVLEDLLFEDQRITSSDHFTVDEYVGLTYASAVDVFQKYGNIRIGENVTLTPSFYKRVPFVVSMNCPQTNMRDVVTDFSGVQVHPTFGPNHTTRIPEVMSKLAQFVNRCCETEMGLGQDTVEYLKENNDMPIATSDVIEHCFAYNPTCGVSAYVGKHSFTYETGVLATLAAVNGNSTEGTPTHAKKEFIVYVAALFSTPVVSVPVI